MIQQTKYSKNKANGISRRKEEASTKKAVLKSGKEVKTSRKTAWTERAKKSKKAGKGGMKKGEKLAGSAGRG